jgi:hypothetical protein
MENNIEEYDSTKDTIEHIKLVDTYLRFLAHQLLIRGQEHDRSKLSSPEKEAFDIHTPNLKNLEYGSEGYQKSLDEMQEALKHHYSVNRHHPEHFEKGILGFNLIDVLEMFADHCASTTRHEHGDINKSIEINKDRFGYGEVLEAIFKNTVRDFNMGRVE